MDYTSRTQLPGERILHRARIHWMIFVFSSALSVLIYFLLQVIFLYPGYDSSLSIVSTVPLLVSSIPILYALAQFLTTEMVVTDKRLIIKIGVFQRKTLEMNIQKVESVSVSQGILGRILAYGTVHAIGTGGTKEPFHFIANALDFRKAVNMAIERSVSYQREPPSSDASVPPTVQNEPPDDIETRLQRLEGLKEKDLLTDAEYQAKREEILGEV